LSYAHSLLLKWWKTGQEQSDARERNSQVNEACLFSQSQCPSHSDEIRRKNIHRTCGTCMTIKEGWDEALCAKCNRWRTRIKVTQDTVRSWVGSFTTRGLPRGNAPRRPHLTNHPGSKNHRRRLQGEVNRVVRGTNKSLSPFTLLAPK
jgi:hypothetical protein